MSASAPVRSLARAMPVGIAYELLRFRTRDGGETTVYLVRHPAAHTGAARASTRGSSSPSWRG